MNDVITLTQALVRCASVTPEDDGAQDVLKKFLKKMGFEIFDLPFDGRGSYPVQNFFARRGKSGPHLCYAGHTDVVPPGYETKWKHPPFSATIEDGVMYGRGTSDMKGGNAAFAAATANFLKKNADFEGSISFLITGDEEADAVNGTVRVLEWMEENGQLPDVCLVGESSNIKELGEEIKVGRRGSLNGTLTVTGRQGHVAYPQFADNPLPRLAAMAQALGEIEFDTGAPPFPPTNLEITNIAVGNSTRNVIPGQGSLQFNIRFNTKWTMQTLDKKLRSILDNVGGEYTLETGGNAHPFLTESPDWVKIVAQAVESHTGRKPALSTSGGTSDARFIASYCPVVEFGLTNETIHQVNETLKIADLEKLVDIYEDILNRFFIS
jgi:succinyl-diaminopimelate desuccinylase